MSDQLVDQSSVVRFIEDNWILGAIGNGSTDALAGSIMPMFDFAHPTGGPLFLDPTTGEPMGGGGGDKGGRADQS